MMAKDLQRTGKGSQAVTANELYEFIQRVGGGGGGGGAGGGQGVWTAARGGVCRWVQGNSKASCGSCMSTGTPRIKC